MRLMVPPFLPKSGTLRTHPVRREACTPGYTVVGRHIPGYTVVGRHIERYTPCIYTREAYREVYTLYIPREAYKEVYTLRYTLGGVYGRFTPEVYPRWCICLPGGYP